MRIIYLVLTTSLLLFWCSCAKEAGCRKAHALNYSPTAEIGLATCSYPSLKLEVALKWGTEPFEVNRVYNLHGHNTAIKTIQFYLSNLGFQSDTINGIAFEEMLSPRYLLITPNELNFDLGQLPSKYIDSLTFNLGIDPSNNGNNVHISDINHPLYTSQNPPMYWNTIDGYIFLHIAGNVDRNGDGIPNQNETFSFEIGTDDLLQSFAYSPSLELTEEEHTILLTVDIQALFNNVDLQTEQSTHTTDNTALATKVMTNMVEALTLDF